MNRRHRLRTTALAMIAAPIAACSVFQSTTTNGVTTITVNVVKLDAYGQAFINGGTMLLDLPGISTLPVAAAISVVLAMLKTDIAALDTATQGQATLTFDSTSVPAAIQSVFTDGKTLLADARSVLGTAEQAAASTVLTYIDALQTVVSIFSATIGQMTAGARIGATPMTETQALAVLRVR
jgi:hypothetical protein